MKRVILLVSCLFLLISFCACQQGGTEDKLTVAVGILPEAAFVEKVAGDIVQVVTMVPPGNSPANYQPTANEMRLLSDADIYFTLQMPAEEANILPKVKDFNEDILIVNLRDAVSAVYPMRTTGDEHSPGVDPHIWLSPERAVIMVRTIADELCTTDPGHAEIFTANAEDYIADIEALDSEIKEKLASISNKSFLIYHGAYGYFADDYGLEMISLESEGKQATAAEMQQAIDFAKQNEIIAVFYQEEFSDSQAETIAEEIGGRVIKAEPLSKDYIEGLRKFADAVVGAEG